MLVPAAAHGQSVPGTPEPGEAVPPAGAAEPVLPTPELEARPSEPAAGWVVLPGVNYTPERGAMATGALLRYFRLSRLPGTRASSLSLTAGISVKGRSELSFDPSVWMMRDRLNIAGTAYASRFDYPYYGIGNDTRAGDREDFTAVRAGARLEVVARVWRSLLAGPLYDARYEDVTAVEEGGLIDSGVVAGGGGLVSGVGGIVRWDSRDRTFAPHRGGLVSLSPRLYRRGLGSDQDFARVVLDASWYVEVTGDHVIALDGRAEMRTGDPPFDHLSLAGGSRLLRGMIEGRYRDNDFLGGQVEYRFPLVWRLGGVAFGGVGRVAHEVDDFDLEGWHWAGGGGLRFAVNRQEGINLRLDAGATVDDLNFYLAIGEAF